MDDVTIGRYDLRTLSSEQRRTLLRPAAGDLGTAEDTARAVVAAVREDGDEALSRLMLEKDGIDLDPAELQITDGDFVHAFERLDPARTRALDVMVNRIRDFHEAEMPKEFWLKTMAPGVMAGHRYRPLESVAFYVPSGDNVRAEAAVMGTIPALIAKVPRVVIVTQPDADGRVSDALLVAAATAGVGEIFKIGGIAAAAALALGTECVPAVDKLVAPKETQFAIASRLLGEHLDFALSGSLIEAIVLADELTAAGDMIAALDDRLDRQSEGAAMLVSTSPELLDLAERHLADAEQARTCSLVLASSLGGAIGFVNEAAPDHLTLLTADPLACLDAIDSVSEIALQGTKVGAAQACRASHSVFDFLARQTVTYVTAPVAANSKCNAPEAGAGGTATLGPVGSSWDALTGS